VALAHPVTVVPLVTSAAPFPIARGPDVAHPGRRNDFDSGWGRCDLDVHIRSGIASDRYSDRSQGQRRNKNSGSHRHVILPSSVEFPVDASVGVHTGQ
jgi:hypothetical protein